MFSSGDLIWIDFEVYGGPLDLKAAGTFRYVAAASTRALVLAYAIGNAPVLTWHADGAILDWDNAPGELRAAFERGATFAAWNASFDAAVWNYATLGFPLLAPERVIDPMVQAGVSNLPTDLERASRYLGDAGKVKDGKALIRLFSIKARTRTSIQQSGSAFSPTRAGTPRRCAMFIARRVPCRSKSGNSTGRSSISTGAAWRSTCPTCAA